MRERAIAFIILAVIASSVCALTETENANELQQELQEARIESLIYKPQLLRQRNCSKN